jgi:hypothetical protein
MIARLLILVSLTTGGTMFMTGAWPSSFSPPAPDPGVCFVAQPITLDADVVGSGVDAADLIAKALANLDPKRVTWLNTKIRQTMYDVESDYVAEGTLQRGPNHCARLDMTIVAQGGKSRLMCVSDGEIAAHVRQRSNAPAWLHLDPLPTTLADREAYLDAVACGGPAAVLRELQPRLQHARLLTGLLGDHAVIQLKAEVNPDQPLPGVATKTRPLHVCVYLDVKTLWPTRVEWLGVDRAGRLVSIMRLEYLDPAIDQELSLAECEQAFSYRPEN